MSTPTYSIELWDHDVDNDGACRGAFSGDLAIEHLEGPNEGLSLRETGIALRKLRQHWSDEAIYVRRDGALLDG